ncbi:MAG: acyl-CoA/acyl-ACP dehydrogenase [Candidatus Tectomicrobia bacterium]|uniref:Acyl-CoA/acyl-ACP dehydrogenase n=1 Tax=Tectimicrobiota bacterium TaxID=2528274 RepID=A0A932CPW7_UNCTE|nr:acyl-CoA/acyl-ACP dehydrogenase [Candidatus Tectomicrobia bacterium]
MNLDFTEEQEALKKTARDFMRKDFPSTLVRELEEDPTGFRDEIWGKIAEMGWLAVIIPEEYEGIGGSFMDLVVLFEEMGRACFMAPFLSTVLCTLPIVWAGSEAQKKELLPKIAGGELVLSLALTEPSATYEAAGISTTAVAEGEDYVINGTKLFIHDAQVAHHFVCATRTQTGGSPEEGITLFLVDAKSPGIQITPLLTVADDKQNEVIFQNVRVPKENRLGPLNQGFPILQQLLQWAMIAKCAEMVGGADWVVENCTAYAKERVQYGHPIGSYGIIQHYLAEMWTESGIAKRFTYYTAWRLDQGLPCEKEVSMTKAFVSEVYRRWTRMGVQVFGGIGTTREHDMGLYYRRARQAALLFGDPDSLREKVAQEMGR